MRHKEVKSLLFDEYLVKADNLNKGNRPITDWFRGGGAGAGAK
jgi:hypothetical protein